MAGEHRLRALAEQLDRLVEVAGPDPRIADQRPAQGEQVVHRVARVLGDEQRRVIGKEEVHLRRRLGARRELEGEADAVDRLLLARLDDVERRVDQGHATDGGGLPQAGGHLAERPGLEQVAEHVAGPPAHRDPGVDVLAHRVLEEAVRRELPARRPESTSSSSTTPARAAEVVDVGVAVDQPRDRPVAAVAPVERERRRRGLAGDQRIDRRPRPRPPRRRRCWRCRSRAPGRRPGRPRTGRGSRAARPGARARDAPIRAAPPRPRQRVTPSPRRHRPRRR